MVVASVRNRIAYATNDMSCYCRHFHSVLDEWAMKKLERQKKTKKIRTNLKCHMCHFFIYCIVYFEFVAAYRRFGRAGKWMWHEPETIIVWTRSEERNRISSHTSKNVKNEWFIKISWIIIECTFRHKWILDLIRSRRSGRMTGRVPQTTRCDALL